MADIAQDLFGPHMATTREVEDLFYDEGWNASGKEVDFYQLRHDIAAFARSRRNYQLKGADLVIEVVKRGVATQSAEKKAGLRDSVSYDVEDALMEMGWLPEDPAEAEAEYNKIRGWVSVARALPKHLRLPGLSYTYYRLVSCIVDDALKVHMLDRAFREKIPTKLFSDIISQLDTPKTMKSVAQKSEPKLEWVPPQEGDFPDATGVAKEISAEWKQEARDSMNDEDYSEAAPFTPEIFRVTVPSGVSANIANWCKSRGMSPADLLVAISNKIKIGSFSV